MAALMATDPSCVAGTADSELLNEPTGVLAALTISTSYRKKKKPKNNPRKPPNFQ